MFKFVEDVKVGDFYVVFSVCKTVKCLLTEVDKLVVMKTGQGELDCVQPGGETGRAETTREM